jgi:chemotaxis protein histidine kinase CheA
VAHTLKGVAGSLEACDLANAAGRIEDALARGDTTRIDELLDQLEQAMLPALAASAVLKSSLTPASVTNVTRADYTASAPMIAEVRDLVRRRSLRARKTFDSLEQALGKTPEAVGLLPIKAALDRLDFAEALLLLDRITGADEVTTVHVRPKDVVS